MAESTCWAHSQEARKTSAQVVSFWRSGWSRQWDREEDVSLGVLYEEESSTWLGGWTIGGQLRWGGEAARGNRKEARWVRWGAKMGDCGLRGDSMEP